LEVSVLAPGHVREDIALVEVDAALDRLAVRVEQQLARVEPRAGRRVVRAVDAVAIALAGPDARQVAVPVVGRAVGHLDPLLPLVGVEEAELDALGVLGEEREVRALAVPHRAEGERLAGPGLGHRATSRRRARSRSR